MSLIINISPFSELVNLVGIDTAAAMKQDAKDYLLFAKKECGGSLLFVEIAAEREIWKYENGIKLSREDCLIDQIAFLSAALDLDSQLYCP